MASFRLKGTSEGQVIQPPLESRADKVVLLKATSRLDLKTSTDENPLDKLFQCFTHYLQSEEKYQLMGKNPSIRLSSQSLNNVDYWNLHKTNLKPLDEKNLTSNSETFWN